MNDTPEQPTPPSNAQPIRIFLVVIDDTDDWRAALRFACRRAEHTGGRVALLRVVEPADFQHWMAVEQVIREERRQEAEQLLQRVARDVIALTGTLPVLHLREGALRDEMMKLIDEEPTLSILVLGANPGKEGPGPLVQYLASKGVARLRIPLTIVPGGLSPEEIDTLA